MSDRPEYSDPGASPLGPGSFASFRAARQRYLTTLTEATVIAQLEASWRLPYGEEDDEGGPGGDA